MVGGDLRSGNGISRGANGVRCLVRATTANAAYAMIMIRSQCAIAASDERGTWPLVAATQLHMGEADAVSCGFYARACCVPSPLQRKRS